MKTVYDRMMENNSYQKTKDFIIKQKWPYASPEAFLANWSPLETTVTVKRRL